MTKERPIRGLSGRSRIITAASILAVGVAGAVAVGANIGILSAAGDTNDVGSLSAEADLAAVDPQVIDVYVDAPASSDVPDTTVTPEAGTIELFTVDVAGTVAFAHTDAGLRLDSVEPSPGWNWVLTQSSNSELSISLTDGVRKLTAVAVVDDSGQIALDVTELIDGSTLLSIPTVNATTNESRGDDNDASSSGSGSGSGVSGGGGDSSSGEDSFSDDESSSDDDHGDHDEDSDHESDDHSDDGSEDDD